MIQCSVSIFCKTVVKLSVLEERYTQKKAKNKLVTHGKLGRMVTLKFRLPGYLISHLFLVFTAVLLMCTNEVETKLQLRAKLYITFSSYKAIVPSKPS